MSKNKTHYTCSVCRYRGPLGTWEELETLSNDERKVISCPNCTTVRTTAETRVKGDHD